MNKHIASHFIAAGLPMLVISSAFINMSQAPVVQFVGIVIGGCLVIAGLFGLRHHAQVMARRPTARKPR